jgi:hypothetical protein
MPTLASARKIDDFGPVVREINPWALDQLARQVPEMFADQVLGAVVRTRVYDDPGIYEWPDRVEATPDHRRLVPHNHAEAKALPVVVHGILQEPSVPRD